MQFIMFYLFVPMGFILIGTSIGWAFTRADYKNEIEVLAAGFRLRSDILWAEAYDRGWMASQRPLNFYDHENTRVDMIPIPTMAEAP